IEPRPAHIGGSVSANAGVGRAALISARGTSVCARRSIRFGNPDAAGVWQTGKSTTPNAGEASAAVALASAIVKTFPVSITSSVTPPRAATAVETSSPCDRVSVAMLSSKIGRTKNSDQSESEIQRVAPVETEGNSQVTRIFAPDVSQNNGNVWRCDT